MGDQPAECDTFRAQDTIMKVARIAAGPDTSRPLLYSHFYAKLPYRILNQGEFRPQVAAPTDLLPLSKQRRNSTTIEPIYTLPGNTDRHVTKERGNKEEVLKCSADAAQTYLPYKHQRTRNTDLVIKPAYIIKQTAPLCGAPKVLLHDIIGAGAGADADRLQVTVEGFKQFPAGQDHVTRARDTRGQVKAQTVTATATASELGPQKFMIPTTEFYRTNNRLQVAANAGVRALPQYNTSEITPGYSTRAATLQVGAAANKGSSLSKVIHPNINTRARQDPVRVSVDSSLHKQFAGGSLTHHFDSQVKVKGRTGIHLPHFR